MKLTLYHIFVYFGTFMVYASLHMLRAGWSYSKADISKEFDVTTGFLGVVDALYLVSYSSGMIILGSMIHRFPLKNYVIIGLTTACASYMLWVVLYSLTGFYSALLMVLFMMLNGFAQSTGWPGIMGIFSSWFAGHKKGLLMGCWSCSANIGDIIASAFLNFLDDNGINFVWNFVFTGCVGLLVSLALLLFLQEKPDQSQLEEDTEQSLIEESQDNREGTEDRERTDFN